MKLSLGFKVKGLSISDVNRANNAPSLFYGSGTTVRQPKLSGRGRGATETFRSSEGPKQVPTSKTSTKCNLSTTDRQKRRGMLASFLSSNISSE
jgi:hypothetical protein